jgi:hypothetical protein
MAAHLIEPPYREMGGETMKKMFSALLATATAMAVLSGSALAHAGHHHGKKAVSSKKASKSKRHASSKKAKHGKMMMMNGKMMNMDDMKKPK